MRSGRLASLLRSRFVRRAGAMGRRAVDLFPFTPLGVVTVGASYVAFTRYGIARVDLLYLVIGAVGLGLAAVSLLLTVFVTLGLWIGLVRAERQRTRSTEAGAGSPLRLECGARTATGFSMPTLWYVPMIRADWSWTRPLAEVRVSRERGRLFEIATPERRGLEDGIERRIEVADAFALTRMAFRQREKRMVRAVPSTGALERLQLSRSIAAGDDIYSPEGATDGERMDIRGYAPGDPIRFVLWKVFAKTRELVVRTPERAISPARRAFAYVVTGRGDEAAAGVARKAIESGALGATYVVGADGVPEDARNADQTLELLARSGSTDVAGGTGLGAFLRRASPAPATRAIVFVPAFDGPWRAELMAAMRTRGRSPMHIIVCTDGMDRQKPRTLLQRLLNREQVAVGKPRMRELEALVTALAATGAEVTLVDRARGHVYAGNHVLARGQREVAA